MSTNEELDEQERRRKENALQRGGVALVVGGGVAGFVVTLAAYMCREATGQPLAYEWVLCAMSACVVTVVAGLVERFTRPLRATLRAVTTNQQAILEQNARIEQTFTDLAAVMPREFDRSWWRGFADRNLAETGTDGTRRQGAPQAAGDLLHFPRPHVPPASSN